MVSETNGLKLLSVVVIIYCMYVLTYVCTYTHTHTHTHTHIHTHTNGVVLYLRRLLAFVNARWIRWKR